ncbi:hypothetical protein [Pandoraea bronchicola]|uniref:Lipoprotein n=1 Tax=Pandoraea bronchicola TaxID=2508287 RepID=A0A5E5BM41_9BURK|nr:hypothetical protein [Pandoraea bronchicola]VVE87331.1 hypothetical protein PBR20603_01260 [Pandoraea bronchicola]
MKRLLMLAGGAAVAVMMAGCVAVPYGSPVYGGAYYDGYGYTPGYDAGYAGYAGYAPGYAVVPAPTVTFGVSGGYYGGGYYRGWHGRGRGWGWHH